MKNLTFNVSISSEQLLIGSKSKNVQTTKANSFQSHQSNFLLVELKDGTEPQNLFQSHQSNFLLVVK